MRDGSVENQGQEARCAWFDGILEAARPATEGLLEDLVARCNATAAVHFDLAVDGGRFTLLADDRLLQGEALSDRRRQDLAEALAALLAALPEGAEVESTLRCTELLASGDRVRETLFVIRDGRLQPLSRERPATLADQRRAAPEALPGGPLGQLGEKKGLVAILLGLLLLVGGLMIWQSGLVDRFFAAQAETLDQDPGPFGTMLTVEVSSSWGRYQIGLRRGPGYPVTPQAVEAALAAATTTADRAAVNMIANGEDIYVQLRDADGELLGERVVSLRPLLGQAEAKAKTTVDGHMRARRLELAIASGADQDAR